jgi:hypothetical protein
MASVRRSRQLQLAHLGERMSNRPVQDAIDDVIRDLDLVVFRLERPFAGGEHQLRGERAEVRREIERLRDKLSEVLSRL